MPYTILKTPQGNSFIRNKRREWYAKFKQNKRKDLIECFGGVCVRCGFSDYRALQLDHIVAVGRKRKTFGANTLLRMMKADEARMRSIYQLLCANCNWIKRHENNETNQGFRKHEEDKN